MVKINKTSSLYLVLALLVTTFIAFISYKFKYESEIKSHQKESTDVIFSVMSSLNAALSIAAFEMVHIERGFSKGKQDNVYLKSLNESINKIPGVVRVDISENGEVKEYLVSNEIISELEYLHSGAYELNEIDLNISIFQNRINDSVYISLDNKRVISSERPQVEMLIDMASIIPINLIDFGGLFMSTDGDINKVLSDIDYSLAERANIAFRDVVVKESLFESNELFSGAFFYDSFSENGDIVSGLVIANNIHIIYSSDSIMSIEDWKDLGLFIFQIYLILIAFYLIAKGISYYLLEDFDGFIESLSSAISNRDFEGRKIVQRWGSDKRKIALSKAAMRLVRDYKKLIKKNERALNFNEKTKLKTERAMDLDLQLLKESEEDKEIAMFAIELSADKNAIVMTKGFDAICPQIMIEASKSISEELSKSNLDLEYQIYQSGESRLFVILKMAQELKLDELLLNTISSIEKEVGIMGSIVYIHASCGYTVFNSSSFKTKVLKDRVSLSCNYSKIKNHKISEFNSEVFSFFQRRVIIENELFSSGIPDGLASIYTPIYSLKTYKMNGVLVSYRWNHPLEGLIKRSEIIPVLRYLGTESKILSWLVEEAFQQSYIWNQARLRDINIYFQSSLEFISSGLLEESINQSSGLGSINKEKIHILLSQNEINRIDDHHLKAIERIQLEGIKIVAFHFGDTGSNISLQSISKIKPDQLAISRSLSSVFGQNKSAHHLLKGISEYCIDMGCDLISLDVDSYQSAKMLKGYGATSVSGAAFNKPMLGHKVQDSFSVSIKSHFK